MKPSRRWVRSSAENTEPECVTSAIGAGGRGCAPGSRSRGRRAVTLTKPMQPAPHEPPGRRGGVDECRRPRPTAPSRTPRRRRRRAARRRGAAARPARVGDAEQHQVDRARGRRRATGRRGGRAPSSCAGLTRWTGERRGCGATSVAIRQPKRAGRSLAPTTATERASSIRPQPGRTAAPEPLTCDGRAVAGTAASARSCERGAGGLHAGDAADPAAGVRGGARVVEARDRGAVVGVPGRRAHVEQLLERELAVEDVAADQAVLLLHLVGPDDVAGDDRVAEAGRHLVVEVDHPVGVGLELLGVRLLAPTRRHPLGEQREDVRAVGVERAVERGRDDAVAERRAAGRPSRASMNARSMNSMVGAISTEPVWCSACAVGRVGGEAGSRSMRQVDLHDTAA